MKCASPYRKVQNREKCLTQDGAIIGVRCFCSLYKDETMKMTIVQFIKDCPFPPKRGSPGNKVPGRFGSSEGAETQTQTNGQ